MIIHNCTKCNKSAPGYITQISIHKESGAGKVYEISIGLCNNCEDLFDISAGIYIKKNLLKNK